MARPRATIIRSCAAPPETLLACQLSHSLHMNLLAMLSGHGCDATMAVSTAFEFGGFGPGQHYFFAVNFGAPVPSQPRV